MLLMQFYFLGGTFPRRTLETGGGPKSQKYNAFVITKACNNPNSIYYRTISCSCQNCSRGELVGCSNHPFVPPLNMSTLRIQEGTPEAPLQAPNATAVRDLLINLQQHHSESLPTFFCLGWVQNQQQPAVLMMSHLCIYKHSVLCHLLPPHRPVVNDFSNTTVEKPNPICVNSACNCPLLHPTKFPFGNILEVCVKKVDRSYRSLFHPTKDERDPGIKLLQLPHTADATNLFNSYAQKRLKIFDDFFLHRS